MAATHFKGPLHSENGYIIGEEDSGDYVSLDVISKLRKMLNKGEIRWQ